MRWFPAILRGPSASEKRAISRFNKVFLEYQRKFRRQIGRIIADHAAKGVLKSGMTVKLGYEELAKLQEQAITECLSLISNKTRHGGQKRKKMLNLLRDQVRGHSNGFGRLAEDHLLKVAGAKTGDAHAAAERLLSETLRAGLDQVDKYDDGLTSPKDESWHQRHPMSASVIAAVLASAITAFAALFLGWL